MTNKKPPKPFVKGDPRINRKGRPKVGMTLAEKVRDAMNEEVKEGTKYTKLDQMIDDALHQARLGKFQYLEALWARGFGKVPDQVHMLVDKPPDLSKLTDSEIEIFLKLTQKAQAD